MKSLSKLNMDYTKLVASDLDGTLIDSGAFWKSIDSKVIANLIGKPVDAAIVYGIFKKSDNIIEYFESLRKTFKIPYSVTEIMTAEAELVKNFYKIVRVKPDAGNVLKLFKERPIMISLVTDCTKEGLEALFNDNKEANGKVSFVTTFEKNIVTSKDVGDNKKPLPDIYTEAFKRRGVKDPKEVIALEDNLNGVIAAKEAGAITVNIIDRNSAADQDKINKIADFSTTHSELKKHLNLSAPKTSKEKE